MPPGIVVIVALAAAAAVAIVKTIASTVLKMREQNNGFRNPPVSSVTDERLARIEAAVEAIAIEVERISEGQRFTTKLLSDQSSPIQAFMSKPGKFDTPH